jgi:carbamate kinase
MSDTESDSKRAVVALGGNAITRKDLEDTIANQFANTRASLAGIIELVKNGYDICITHGNGPQVGNAIFRVELARGKAPILPLGICVADTEGGMGYMIEQSLQNYLDRENLKRNVCTIITQVVVDKDDPSVANPTKYIGQFYSEEEAKRFKKSRNWVMKKDADRGWRRVVASPIPKWIVEREAISLLLEKHYIVIAAGGGGIPVYIDEKLGYEGFDAVIDKDRASAVLGHDIGAELLVILTSVDNVAVNFGKPDEKKLGEVALSEMEKYYSDGHFPAGSMGPKVEAAMNFLKQGGKRVIITSIDKSPQAMHGKAGTQIVPDEA